MLLEEFLKPLGLTQVQLAEELHVPFQRINQIVRGRRGITPDTALRLSALFDTTPEFWLNMQQTWDLYEALHSATAKDVRRIKPIRAAS